MIKGDRTLCLKDSRQQSLWKGEKSLLMPQGGQLFISSSFLWGMGAGRQNSVSEPVLFRAINRLLPDKDGVPIGIQVPIVLE